MISKLKIKGYDCHCARYDGATEACYMIYPALAELEDKWLDRMAQELRVNLVMVYVPANDWNNVLTPWAEPPEAKGFDPFDGKSLEFLKFLQTEVIPEVEAKEGLKLTARDLLGVSLGGLFTLWQWMLCDTFRSIACLSGSFWYPSFLDWFESQPLPAKQGRAFFLLGEEEPHAHIVAYQSVGKNTEAIVERLKKAGISVEFDWVPGNHFSRPVHRAELALHNLYPDNGA